MGLYVRMYNKAHGDSRQLSVNQKLRYCPLWRTAKHTVTRTKMPRLSAGQFMQETAS